MLFTLLKVIDGTENTYKKRKLMTEPISKRNQVQFSGHGQLSHCS